MPSERRDGEVEQTDPVTALTDAIDQHYDDDQSGAPVGRVVEEMLSDPTIDLGDVSHALKEGSFHGVVYQPSPSTIARVATDGGRDQLDGGIDRRSFVSGSLATLGIIGGIAMIATARDADEETDRAIPSSELVSAEPSVYDEYAGMCGIDLLLDVAESERVVIQNEVPGGSDRTVENSGERILRAVVPWDSTILIYAVGLDSNTSKVLKKYRVSEECTLSEVDDGE